MSDWNYERSEIAKALTDLTSDDTLRLKIVGDHGESRWLTVTVKQARAIQNILSGE